MKANRIFSLLLACAMLFSVLPMAVFAEGDVTAEEAVSHYPTCEYPHVELYDEYIKASFEWFEDGVSLDWYESGLYTYENELKLFSTYTCEITLTDGSQFSVEFEMLPIIERQPNNYNPQIITSGCYTEDITYQWYARSINDVIITDKNASNECSTCENTSYSSYDADKNEWTGKKIGIDANDDNEFFAFEIELKEGEQLLVDTEFDATTVRISDVDYDIMTEADYTMVGNVFCYSVEHTDTYKITVCTPNDSATFSAAVRTVDEEFSAVENETNNYLDDFELGKLYKCIVTYENGYTLESNTIMNTPDYYSEPTASEPVFETSYAEYAQYQWYQIIGDLDSDDYVIVKLEGENTSALKNPEIFCSYFCEAKYPAFMNLISDVVEMTPEIINQPTTESPTLEVTFGEYATYQWYLVDETNENTTYETITDKNQNIEYISGTYDADSGLWTPDYGDPYEYEDYEERRMTLFEIYLDAGDTVKVTITNPDAISPEDPDFRFNCIGGDIYYVLFDGDSLYFTAEFEGTYELYQYGIYPEETQYKIETYTYQLEEIEGETEATLQNAQRGNLYIAKAFFDNDFELMSKPLNMAPAIVKQPTVEDVSVKMNIIEDTMKYQWYVFEKATDIVTPDMIEYTNLSNPSTYDEETNEWTPIIYDEDEDDSPEKYELDLFILTMKLGDTIVFEASEAITGEYIRVFDNNGDFGENIYPDEDGLYIFTAPEDIDAYFYFNHYTNDISLKASLNSYSSAIEIDGEDEAYLKDVDLGVYQCVITYDEDTVIYSDKVYVSPVITKQPTAEDPSVSINITNGKETYQWYSVEITSNPVTDEDATDAMPTNIEEDTMVPESRYDAEKDEWTALLVDSGVINGQNAYMYLFFYIDLEAGETISITSDCEFDENYFYVSTHNKQYKAIKNGDSYVFTAGQDDTYVFYAIAYSDDVVKFKASTSTYKFAEALEGETESALKTKKAGNYACVITTEDGTEIVSDIVTLEAMGDVSGNGITDSTDYLLVKRACFKTYDLSDDEFARADIDDSGKIDSTDYTLVKRIAFGTLK